MHLQNHQKPKLLMALFRIPYPATDGTRYKLLHNIAAGFMREYEIEFFIVNIKAFTYADIEYLEKNFGKVHLFHHSKIAFALNGLRALVSGIPMQSAAFHFSDAQQWLDECVEAYDAVYIHEIRMTEFFIQYSDHQKKKFLVDFNDAISMNYRQSVEGSKIAWWKRWFYHWEGKRVAKYEARVVNRFHHLSVVSAADREHILGLPDVKNLQVDFSVIHHGVPLMDQLAVCDKQELFFLGSLDYEPNRDALTFFLSEIWPQIHTVFPQVILHVVGGGSVLTQWKKVEGVVFHGFVPNVFETVKHCRALVAPIRFAGGTPSKIIEAMGYGIPVITSPEGIAGITEVVSGEHALVASTVDEWVRAITQVLTVDQREMAVRARALVERYYSQNAAQDQWAHRMKQIESEADRNDSRQVS